MSHPFLDALSGGGDEEHPFLASINQMFQSERLNTARGRQAADVENRLENVGKLQELLDRPGVSPAQRRRIERLIRNNKPGWTRPADSNQGAASNIARGTAASVTNVLPDLVDLGSAAINAALPGQPAARAREWAQETRQQNTEFFNPQGAAGLIGEIGGGIVGGAGPYTLLTRGVARGLLGVLPAGSRAAQIIQAAETGTRGQRLAGQTAISMPLDALYSATLEDASLNDKLLAFGINVAANAAGSQLPATRAKPAPKAPSDVTSVDPARAANLPGDRSATTNAKIDEMVSAGGEAEAANKAAKQARKEARQKAVAAWRTENSGKKWGDVPKEQQVEWLAEYAARAPEGSTADANLDTFRLGNREQLQTAAKSVDDDGELAYIFGDLNGLKGINDRVGKEAGDAFLAGTVNAMRNTLRQAGAPERIFRWGGDEFVAIVPKARAAELRDAMEVASLQKHGNEVGNMSAEIFDRLDDALTKEGGSAVETRKIIAKAQAGIPGRDEMEQRAIDAMKRRLSNREAGQGELFGGTPMQGTPTIPDPTQTAGAPRAVVEPVARESSVTAQPEVVAGSGSAAPVEAPRAGMVRLYHAGQVQPGGKTWVTRDLADAEGWARDGRGKLWYVDVPEEFGMLKNPDYPDQPGPQRIELPKDFAQQMKSFDEAQPVAIQTATAIPTAGGLEAASYVMDEQLAKSAPRYAYGSKQFTLSFDSDLDRAAYILQGSNKSKAHDKILQDVLQKTGLTKAEVQAHGDAVRSRIKQMASEQPAGKLQVSASDSQSGAIQSAPATTVAPVRSTQASADAGPTIADVRGAEASVEGETASVNNFIQGIRDDLQAGKIEAESARDLSDTRTAANRVWESGMSQEELNAKTAAELRKMAGEEMRQAEASRSRGSNTGVEFRNQRADRMLDLAKRVDESGAPRPQYADDVEARAIASQAELDALIESIRTPQPDPALTAPDPTEIPPASPLPDPTPSPDLPTPTRPVGATAVRQELSIPHPKPIDEMTLSEIDDLKDVIDDMLDLAKTDTEINALSADIKRLAARTRQLRDVGKAITPRGVVPDLAAQGLDVSATPAQPRTTPEPSAEVKPKKVAKPKMNKKVKEPEAEPITKPAALSPLFKKNVNLLMSDELAPHKVEVEARLETPLDPNIKELMKARLRKINERLAEIESPAREDGMMVQMPPELGGAVAGFFMGATVGDTEEERRQNAIGGMMLGIGAGYGLRRYQFRRPQTAPPTQPGQAALREQVVSQTQIDDAAKQRGFLSRMEDWYQTVVRPSHSWEKATERAGGKKLPAHLNPGKRLSMFGAWVSQSEEFMFGRPSLEGPDGNRVPIPGVRNAQEVAQLAQGDTQSLGELMAAMTVIEQYQKTGRNRTGMNLQAAVQFAKNAPEYLHEAVREARKLHLAMLDVMMDAGIISPEARVKMSEEEFYAPLERVFGMAIGEKPKGLWAAKGTGKPGQGEHLSAPNPVKSRKQGSQRPIRNPFETMVANIPRVMRAAEMNKVKQSLIELRQANPTALEGLIDYAPGTAKPQEETFLAAVNAIKAELDLTGDEATALVSAFSPDALTPISNTMAVWRQGKLENWRLDPYLAGAAKTMNHHELGTLAMVLGAVNQPARTGIVNNPLFIAWQAFRDNWQATLNSEHGFRPGIDWALGWWEGMKRSPEYRNYLAGGGGHSAFAQREVLNTRAALRGIKTEGRTALGTAAAQLRVGDVADAWHTMITPITEAARIGEYLRARGRGASVVEAVYHAKEVVGNFQRIAPAIRALNHTTLFLNPAIKSLDVALTSAGVNPFRTPEASRRAAAARYLTKAFALITAPSMMFLAASADDQEITDLRRTESGKRYWWFRDWNDKIRRIPKPIFEGQVFGTSVEVALDTMREQNPDAFMEWVRAVRNDAAFNLLPTAITVPGSVWANKDVAFGSPIVPGGVADLEAQYQARSNSSIGARVLSSALAPVSEGMESEVTRRLLSPAGIDFLIRGFGGTLAGDAAQALTIAHNYNKEDYLPPAAEWPIIRGALVNYPLTATRPVEDFYRRLEVVDRRAKTFEHLSQSDLVGMMEYYERYRDDIGQAEMFRSARQSMTDLRQAIEDIDNAPPGTITPQEKRRVKIELTKQIIEQARIITGISREMSRDMAVDND